MTPQGSHTVWADWVQRPARCAICGQRATLKQHVRQNWNELTHTGRVVHVACEQRPGAATTLTRPK